MADGCGTIVVKNPAPVAHNFLWTSDNNGSHNPNIAAKTDWKMPNALAKEPAERPQTAVEYGDRLAQTAG